MSLSGFKPKLRQLKLLSILPINFFSSCILQVTELFDKLVGDEPDRIQCPEEKLALNDILKINTSDPSSGPLRIPKQNERPPDVVLASGYTSE